MHIRSILITSFLLLLILTFGAFLYQKNNTQPNSSTNTSIQITPLNQQNIKSIQKKSKHIDSKNSDEFYKPIIENNIFRRLGWKPPKKPEEFILYGTASTEDERKSKAYIYETQSKRLHTVKVGDTIGKAKITEIGEKQVKMDKDGKEIKLQCGKMRLLR